MTSSGMWLQMVGDAVRSDQPLVKFIVILNRRHTSEHQTKSSQRHCRLQGNWEGLHYT